MGALRLAIRGEGALWLACLDYGKSLTMGQTHHEATGVKNSGKLVSFLKRKQIL